MYDRTVVGFVLELYNRSMSTSRRSFLASTGSAALGFTACSPSSTPSEGTEPASNEMTLGQFEPKSMLFVPQNPVGKARYPVIDMHTHISSVFRRTPDSGELLQGSPVERLDQIVRWMDRAEHPNACQPYGRGR